MKNDDSAKNVHHIKSYSYESKTYTSSEEMPDDIRELFNKLMSDDNTQHEINSSSVSYEFNGQKYDSFESMPAEAQQVFRDDNNNGIPDIFEN